MLLGGLRYLLPVIEAAHKLGIYVITCDYLPGNIAHKYSDEYHNVSIINKEAVLKLARELEIDGIMSFAVDPGVVTAAYVAEQMGLPNVGPYESVCILQDKAKFRKFLRAHHFNCPWSFGFSSVDEALAASHQFSWPAIVKPTDAAGSKGVTRVNTPDELPTALNYAADNSLSGDIIVEEFIQRIGSPTGSDSFAIEGKLEFVSFDNQYFDPDSPNPYTPSAHIWPSTMPLDKQEELKAELQRLLNLLHMRTAVFNIEARVGTDGKVYIMEVSPRGGGNRLSEVLKLATGVDLITNAVRDAVGLPVEGIGSYTCRNFWAIVMVHSKKNGILKSIEYSEQLASRLVQADLLVSEGSEIREFKGANDALGHLIVNCTEAQEIQTLIREMENHVHINLEYDS